MNEIRLDSFGSKVSFCLDYTITELLYELFKNKSKYDSFVMFCKGMYDGINLKSPRSLNYLTEVLLSFQMVSGFNDELGINYILRYLKMKDYVKYMELCRLEFEIRNGK